jgi:hypothetical protein
MSSSAAAGRHLSLLTDEPVANQQALNLVRDSSTSLEMTKKEGAPTSRLAYEYKYSS